MRVMVFMKASEDSEMGMAPTPEMKEAFLRQGLETRTGTPEQFAVYLQPKVDLRSGRTHGAEALARWNHPTHGVITPARFVARADSPIRDVQPELVEGKKIAVVAGTAHEAFLKQMFTEAELHPYPNAEAARAALRNKEVDLLFGDGIALAFWLNGTDSAGCCVFRGGPYLESRFFGEGISIAVKPGNDLLRQALNWALFRQWEKGSYTDLWLRYFPISPF